MAPLSDSSTTSSSPIIDISCSPENPDGPGVHDIGYTRVKVLQSIEPNLKSKYPVLLPKPLPPPRILIPTDRKKLSTLNRPGPCRIPRCPLKHCTLRSHKHYDARWSHKQHLVGTQAVSQQHVRNTRPDEVTRSATQPPDSPSILSGGVDGLPALPLDGLEEPPFRAYFHHFFSYLYGRLVRLHYPPPQTVAGKMLQEKAKQKALGMALTQPMYCLHYIATSQNQVLFNRVSKLDKGSTILLGKMMSLLRAKLDAFDQSEICNIVLVILTIVTFEIATGRTKALVQHRKAFHHLTESNGGLFVMGAQTSLIQALDRILSIFTGLSPLYAPPVNQFVRKPTVTPIAYGHWLEDEATASLLGQGLHQYCIDVCRLVELVEREGISFDPRDAPLRPSQNLYYFFFLRDCVVYDYIRLQNATLNEQTLARCVLLVTKIVDYTVLLDNYLKLIPIRTADRIQEIVTSDSSKIVWSDHASVLRWILFVLVSMPSPWDGRPWAMGRLRQELRLKYPNGPWPSRWQKTELKNVRAFVWSNSRLNGGFLQSCVELDTDGNVAEISG